MPDVRERTTPVTADRARLSRTLPTDRDKRTPDIGVGIDTAAISGPTSEALLAVLHNQYLRRDVDLATGEMTEYTDGGSTWTQIGLTRAKVSVRLYQGELHLRTELSLPTMLYGHNRNALPTALAIDALDAVLTDLGRTLPDVPSIEQCWPSRVDLARDFQGVASLSDTLTDIGRQHVRQAQHHAEYFSPNGDLQTLIRGTKGQYVVRGYGKAAELRSRGARGSADRAFLERWAAVSEGQLRVELELRAPLLRRKGLTAVTDLTSSTLDDLAQHYFDWCRFDIVTGGATRISAQIEAEVATGTTAAEIRNLCALILSDRVGIAAPMSRNPLEDARALANRLGLLGVDVTDDREPRRLDFDTGVELAGGAALRPGLPLAG
jgi:hypothetical protein